MKEEKKKVKLIVKIFWLFFVNGNSIRRNTISNKIFYFRMFLCTLKTNNNKILKTKEEIFLSSKFIKILKK